MGRGRPRFREQEYLRASNSVGPLAGLLRRPAGGREGGVHTALADWGWLRMQEHSEHITVPLRIPQRVLNGY